MVNLIDTRNVIEDNWIRLADGESLDKQSRVIISLSRLKREEFKIQNSKLVLGVELEPDAMVSDLSAFIDALQLVVLQFDSFADGRAFSQAKLLRDRYHYSGEIRATGEVIRDQLGFMQRCGFSQFEIADNDDSRLALQAFTEITHGYQADLICSITPGENQVQRGGHLH